MQGPSISVESSAMSANDKAYFLRRALQEEEAARTATCDAARERHRILADAYRLECSNGRAVKVRDYAEETDG